MVLVTRLDRLGRSTRELLDLIEAIAKVAEFERGEGRKRAQANGVKFGRKPKLSDYQRKEAIKRRAAGETLAEIAPISRLN